MYKWRLLWSTLFLRTPTYSGRSFKQALLEQLEYSILFCFIDSTKELVKYQTTASEQKQIIFNWGRMWLLIDDLQDEKLVQISDQVLKKVLLGQHLSPSNDRLIKELEKSANFINHQIAKTKHWSKYQFLSEKCFNNQNVISNLRTNPSKLKQLLKASENKGGSFALSLVLALNPTHLNREVSQAIFIAGGWGQAIDDFADISKDLRSQTYTIFSAAKKPELALQEACVKYKSKISYLIPAPNHLSDFFSNLTQLAKVSHWPIFSTVFNIFNG